MHRQRRVTAPCCYAPARHAHADARDAMARLAVYEPMMIPLIESDVLTRLIDYVPVVKPFNRLPPGQWGPEALREINNTLFAIDQLLFCYTKMGREDDLPVDVLACQPLTSWVCDVLHGAKDVAAAPDALQCGNTHCRRVAPACTNMCAAQGALTATARCLVKVCPVPQPWLAPPSHVHAHLSSLSVAC
eukprot:286944-Chlamydomonas_euryale.AAC.4